MSITNSLLPFLLWLSMLHAVAQSPSAAPSNSQSAVEKQTWIDPATNLMWAARDNGRDVSLRGARRYCQKLKTAGFTDWRLADIEELWAIFERTPLPAQRLPNRDYVMGGHVKGGLILSRREWSVTHPITDDGRLSPFAYTFDFLNGRDIEADASLFGGWYRGRALCVRGTQSGTQQ